MSWARSLLAAPLMVLPVAGHALTQVPGPLQIGPSIADGNAQTHSASLATTLTNQGDVADRLINVACPGTGTVGLTNGHVQPVGPGSSVQRNGLDIPAAALGRPTPVQARFDLTDATLPMLPGTLVSCVLWFQHAGQRIVIFPLGVHEGPTNEP